MSLENLELKARCHDLSAAHDKAITIASQWQWRRVQSDTYFAVPEGKMKLREVEDAAAELITYHRPAQAHAKYSAYQIYRTEAAESLINTLKNLFPVEMVIRKTRTLFLWKEVRIHLDEVEGLGDYIEFEAVITNHAGRDQARTHLKQLQIAFDISVEDLCAVGYYELLQQRTHG